MLFLEYSIFGIDFLQPSQSLVHMYIGISPIEIDGGEDCDCGFCRCDILLSCLGRAMVIYMLLNSADFQSYQFSLALVHRAEISEYHHLAIVESYFVT